MRAIHNSFTGTTVCLDCMRVDGPDLDEMLECNENLILLSPGLRKLKADIFPYGESCGICERVVVERKWD